MKNGRKLFTLLLVVVLLCTTCFEAMGVSAAEVATPKVDQALARRVAEAAWEIIPEDATVVTPSAIGVGVEVTPPAIEIVPPLPCPHPHDEVLPVPPQPTYEPTYEVEIPEHVEIEVTGITEITEDEDAEEQAPPVLSYEEMQEMYWDMERGRIKAWLIQSGLDMGIVESNFRPAKRLTYGQFALMVYNSISIQGQIPDSKESRNKAIEWIKEEYNITYKASKKMSYTKVSKVISKVLGKKGTLWNEEFKNLEKEAEMLLPSMSLGGGKISAGHGLYMILMTLEPDISYGPMTVQENNQNG